MQLTEGWELLLQFNVIMLINQAICEERVAIYETEKDTIKKIDGEIVTFAGERKKQPSPMDHCLNGVIQIIQK